MSKSACSTLFVVFTSLEETVEIMIWGQNKIGDSNPLGTGDLWEHDEPLVARETWVWSDSQYYRATGLIKSVHYLSLWIWERIHLRTNSIKFRVDKQEVWPACRVCGEREETVAYVVAECAKLAQKHYKNWRRQSFPVDTLASLQNMVWSYTWSGSWIREHKDLVGLFKVQTDLAWRQRSLTL